MKLLPLPCALNASLALLLAGCAAAPSAPSSRLVKVDAVARSAAAASAVSYVIRAKPGQEDSLRYREVARLVRAALGGRGLYEAPGNIPPDLVIEIDFGMVPTGLKQETVVMPVYAQSASEIPEIIGYRAVVYPVAHHDKYLTIVAHIRDENGDERRLAVAWRVQASIQDEAEDLRACLPILAAAVMEQIAQDTQGTEEITLGPGDPLVAFVRKAM
ncbi:MAG TPA: hypothetical protein VEB66_08335 [Opitutaceae bacterium]|nr:hypothetical protein [Opitutaceae bacterium]